MRSVISYIRQLDPRLWVMVGKGPTFSGHSAHDLSACHTLGLNHVVNVLSCTINHFTDLEALLDCHQAIRESCRMIAVPWRMHVNNRPGKMTLPILVQHHSLLQRLVETDRLLSYNSTLSKDRKSSLPTIRVRYFSAVAGLNILAAAGVKTIRTLGIDGGASYAKEFDRKTLLSNSRSSFDVQFQEMKRTIKEHGLDCRPL